VFERKFNRDGGVLAVVRRLARTAGAGFGGTATCRTRERVHVEDLLKQGRPATGGRLGAGRSHVRARLRYSGAGRLAEVQRPDGRGGETERPLA
jgi:hypothetical protein